METGKQLVYEQRTHGLTNYLNGLASIDLLSTEDEIALFEKKNDTPEEWEKAKNELIDKNRRFVVSVAKKYQGQGVPLYDLISEGNIGLIKAIDNYDITHGTKLISYAVWWIKQRIRMEISNSRTIRLPLNKEADYQKVKKINEKFLNEQCISNVSFDLLDVVSSTGKKIDDSMASNLTKINQHTKSLNDKVGTSSNMELSEFIEGGVFSFEKDIENEYNKKLVDSLLVGIDEKTREMIEHYYGLNGKTEMTLQDIGEKYEITKERVRQIIKRKKDKMKKKIKESGIMEYI